MRIREESPPREEDCPIMLARWYLRRPPDASIWARIDAERISLLEVRACVSCFWRVWWVRIRVRVAREEREVGDFCTGGRVWERSLGFLGFFFLEAMTRVKIDRIPSQLKLTGWCRKLSPCPSRCKMYVDVRALRRESLKIGRIPGPAWPTN